MTRTYYLSFADDVQFRGGCYVDVTETDAEMALMELSIKFPNARPGAEWLAAAIRIAHRLDCNPGGEVEAIELPPELIPPHVERGRLYSKEEIEAQ